MDETHHERCRSLNLIAIIHHELVSEISKSHTSSELTLECQLPLLLPFN